MSAEEDFYFETLRVDRVQAKLAVAEAIAALASQGRVENGKGIEALARAFNLMPPAFGVDNPHQGGHDGSHNHEEGDHDAHPHPHPHPHAHPHPHPGQSHRAGPAQSDASGIGLATLIAQASAEIAEARAGVPREGRREGSGEGPRPASEPHRKPLVSRGGLLTAEGATQIRLAVLKAKIALAEAVTAASPRAEEAGVCDWILSLTTAFDALPAPIIIVAESEE